MYKNVQVAPIIALSRVFEDEALSWEIRTLDLSWEKLMDLWTRLQEHPTVFSDITRGDFDNWVNYVTSGDSLWLEIIQNEELVGLVTVVGFKSVVDVEIHMIFFDRRPAVKRPLIKLLIRWLFDNFGINRVSVSTPEMYHALVRLLRRIGFRLEGTKRQSALMGGKWIDMQLYGILREEVMSNEFLI